MSDYDDRERERKREWKQKESAKARDIGDIPACVNPERRAIAEQNLLAFMGYFPNRFFLEFSENQLSIIQRVQLTILQGGSFVYTMARGGGKTSIAEVGVMWAVMNGHHRMATFFGATDAHSTNLIKSIKIELETNQALLEDYPEICWPFWALEGEARRAGGQIHKGNRTRIAYEESKITLATILDKDGKPLKASGNVISCSSFNSAHRGAFDKKPDGSILRASLVIPDDPETDEIANNPILAQKRYKAIKKLVTLKGPGGVSPTLLVPCTCICEGDVTSLMMADKSFRRAHHRLVDGLPENMKLWHQYWEIRTEEIAKDDIGMKASTEFYRANQAAMDAGCISNWPQRFDNNQISPVQFAMDIYLADPETFFAEMQNEPRNQASEAEAITEAGLIQKLNQRQRSELPDSATKLTAFIDIHESVLVWMVCAWNDTFSGAIVDYGYWPDDDGVMPIAIDQARLQVSSYDYDTDEQRMRHAVDTLLVRLFGTTWERNDGLELQLSRVMIDVAYGKFTDLLFATIVDANRMFANRITPSFGKTIKATQPLWSIQQKDKTGDRIGLHWRITKAEKRIIPHALYDTNFWKTFLANRISSGKGEIGSLGLFGDKIYHHNTLVQHFLCQRRMRVEYDGKTVDEWKPRPGLKHDHLFDAAVGNCLAASIEGCKLPNTEQRIIKPKFRPIPKNLGGLANGA